MKRIDYIKALMLAAAAVFAACSDDPEQGEDAVGEQLELFISQLIPDVLRNRRGLDGKRLFLLVNHNAV